MLRCLAEAGMEEEEMAQERIHDIWNELRTVIAEALAAVGINEPVEMVEPPNPEMGHLGFPVMSFAKTLRKAPQLIANEVASHIPIESLVRKVLPVGGYVNLFLDELELSRRVLACVLQEGDQFASRGAASQARRYLLEYSSPNTNKPLHLGHIRNNLLGLGISNILSYFGHEMIRVNLINDRGIHICKTMIAYKKWGEGQTPTSLNIKGDHYVGSLYVRFENALRAEYKAWVEANGAMEEESFFNGPSKLGAEARELLLLWESGDPDTRSLWATMNSWVYEGFDVTYKRMGCTFDQMQYESQTYQAGKALVQEGLAKGILRTREDGAVVFPLERLGLEGEKVLLRPDGTSVYMTQDLGTALQRYDTWTPDQILYVVGDEQLYHFQVLFGIMDRLRPGVGSRCNHLSYGMVRLPEGRMKSREGKVVDADDLMDELHEMARQELSARVSGGGTHHEGLSTQELALRAERIAQAALKFFVFKFTPKKSFEYNPSASIDFNGQTGPYCLYNYARTRSLIRKGALSTQFDPSLVDLLQDPSEAAIVRKILHFPKVVAWSAANYDPSRIAEYVYDLAAQFAKMFTDKEGYPILSCPDAELRQARLMLAQAVGITVRSALGLLGIETLEEM